jgi:hypothetical protein
MIKVNKKINLAQLDKELNGKGLNGVMNENGEIIEISFAENNDATESQLKKALDAHVAIDEVKAKQEARKAILDRIGLTDDELKTILG